MASHESVCQLSDDELYSKLSQAIIAPEFRVLQCECIGVGLYMYVFLWLIFSR